MEDSINWITWSYPWKFQIRNDSYEFEFEKKIQIPRQNTNEFKSERIHMNLEALVGETQIQTRKKYAQQLNRNKITNKKNIKSLNFYLFIYQEHKHQRATSLFFTKGLIIFFSDFFYKKHFLYLNSLSRTLVPSLLQLPATSTYLY